jgi:hypothetical protein
MTKVAVMTDGYVDQASAEVMIELADGNAAAEVSTKLNGIVARFDNADAAEDFRREVLSDSRLKGKLASLSIGEA